MVAKLVYQYCTCVLLLVLIKTFRYRQPIQQYSACDKETTTTEQTESRKDISEKEMSSKCIELIERY